MIQACLVEMDIDVKATRFPKADVLADIFSLAVNKEKPVAGHSRGTIRLLLALAPQIAALQQRYAARKKAANGMDFDDLLALWLKLLREHRRNPRRICSAGSNSSSWTNTRTPTKSRAT